MLKAELTESWGKNWPRKKSWLSERLDALVVASGNLADLSLVVLAASIFFKVIIYL